MSSSFDFYFSAEGKKAVFAWQATNLTPSDTSSFLSIVLHATAIVAASGVSGPVQDSGNANPDNDLRNVGGSGQNAGYIFNLSTAGLATGTYALQFTVSGDPVVHTVMFGVH